MKTNNKDSRKTTMEAFIDGGRYCDATMALEMAGMQLVDIGNRLSIETRLSSWINYETAFVVAKELNKRYNIGSWNKFETNRGDFIRHHEDLCYQDIALMRKSGELKELGINWRKSK